MATTIDIQTGGPERSVPRPLELTTEYSRPDRVYRTVARATAFGTLVLLFLIGLFLVLRGWPSLVERGWKFFTTSGFQTIGAHPQYGVLAPLVGTLEVAGIAIVVGAPVAVATALFISEYAPAWSRRSLIAVIDLAAAIPSVIFGLWGIFVFGPKVAGFSGWLAHHASFIPFFATTSTVYTGTIFIAGLVVGIMIVPIVASISREVFSLAPPGEREAALALGATRWQMIRTVVLPFGRGGMIGAVMLGLGRALEETIAVSLILASSLTFSLRVLQPGGTTISQFIATHFFSGGRLGLQTLLMCGFVLFVLTLVINLAASAIVNRSRSGAGVEL